VNSCFDLAFQDLQFAARAQQRVPVIGYLSAGSETGDARYINEFRKALGQAGYVEGRDIEILFRFAALQFDRLPALASDLVARRVAVIIASGGAASVSAKVATTTIPIVFESANDPIQMGLVTSVNRPDRNLTGATVLNGAYFPKAIEMMHELLPQGSSFAFLTKPTNPTGSSQISATEDAARTLQLRLGILKASNLDEIKLAFSTLAQGRFAGLIVASDKLFAATFTDLAALALQHRVPTILFAREFAQAGGLMSYGASIADAHRIVGNYVARILKGEKPADLPVQQSTRIEMVLNLKTAKALALDVPTSILLRADEVIE
jgi:putative ABC transport system substrate-binding protein